MGLADFKNSIVTKDQFSQTFNKFDRSVQGSARGLDKMGGILSGGGLGMLFGGMAGVAGVAAITKTAFALGDLGAQSLTTKASFDSLMKSVGLSTGLLDQLKEASGGTITELTLMQQANTALAGSSGQLATEMGAALPKLLEAARAAAKLNPAYGDAEFMFQSLVGGIKRGTPLLIDNTGIVLKVGEATEAYAASIGKSVTELTSQERSLAILRGTLEGADRLLEQTAGSTNSMASSAGKLKTAWMELKTTIGEGLAPTTSGIQEGLAETFIGINAALEDDAITLARQELARMEEQYVNTSTASQGFLDKLIAIVYGENAQRDALERSRQSIMAQRVEVKRLENEAIGLANAEETARWATMNYGAAARDSAQASQTAGINASALAATLQGLRNAYSIATGAASQYAAVLGGNITSRAFIGGADVLSQGQYASVTQGRINLERGLQVQVLAGIKTQMEADYALAQYDNTVNDHIASLRTQSTAVASTGAAYDDLKSKIGSALRPTFDLSGLTGGLMGGLGGDSFDEAYKRLAAVALRPQEELAKHAGDWAGTFEQAGLTGLTPEEAAARARELVEAYSKGLDFSLIDREAIKNQVRQAIKAEEIYNTIVDEIYAEMGKDKTKLADAGGRMGTQLNRGMIAEAKSGAKDVAFAYMDVMEPEIIRRLDARYRRTGQAQ